MKCVYESDVTGLHLCRELRAAGVDCVIGAVSKMHKPAADYGRSESSTSPTGTRTSSPNKQSKMAKALVNVSGKF